MSLEYILYVWYKLTNQIDIQTVQKFAQLEFKYGEAERGRTLLEGIVSNHPKRLDLWNVYLDMEIKVGDVEMAR